MNLITRARESLKYRLGPKPDTLREDLSSLLDRIPTDFGGGSGLEKVYEMASLIRQFKIKSSVDIGVYRGRSLFPQAFVHKKFTRGIVYGVDPWDAEEAKEMDNPELFNEIEAWRKTTDFEGIFREVSAMSREFGRHCKIVRKTSREASEDFKRQGIRFGVVHIDGNHDTARALEDVRSYLPLLHSGGFMVLDDISWKSVRPAYDLCLEHMTLYAERVHLDYSIFTLPR